MKIYEWIGKDRLHYILTKIKDLFYTKSEVDYLIASGGGGNAYAIYHTTEEWEELNPILGEGEFGIDSIQGFMKIGDGKTHWNDMDFAVFPVSLSQRGDNLLLKENGNDLFLSEAEMKKLMLEVIIQYHGEGDLREFVTADAYSFLTADGRLFTQKGQNA